MACVLESRPSFVDPRQSHPLLGRFHFLQVSYLNSLQVYLVSLKFLKGDLRRVTSRAFLARHVHVMP